MRFIPPDVVANSRRGLFFKVSISIFVRCLQSSTFLVSVSARRPLSSMSAVQLTTTTAQCQVAVVSDVNVCNWKNKRPCSHFFYTHPAINRAVTHIRFRDNKTRGNYID